MIAPDPAEKSHPVPEPVYDFGSTPQAGQSVSHAGKTYVTVREGLAYILVPQDAIPSTAPKKMKGVEAPVQTVFYNPIQQFNRDLTVLAIKTFGEESVLEKQERWKKRIQRNARKEAKGVKRKRQHGDEETTPRDLQEASLVPPPPEMTGSIGIEEGNDQVPLPIPSEQAEDRNTKGAVPVPLPPTKQYKPEFRILDALSATGLRALRYAHEIPYATSITANDLSPEATKSIEVNVQYNKLEGKIEAVTGSAQAHMYMAGQALPDVQNKSARKYDVVDIDPYGSAAPFFDAAVQSLADGGLLCATCTDPSVFASVGYPEKTFALYGGVPLKGQHSHEGGLRLILNAIAMSAARYGLAIEPLLSLSIDYYARVFVRIRRSPAELKFLAGKSMVVYNCDQGCGAWSTQLLARHKEITDKKSAKYYSHGLAQGPSAAEKCQHCGFKTHLAGPMYAGPLHSSKFVRRILEQLPSADSDTYATKARIEGMLLTALEEDISPQPDPSPASSNGPPAPINKIAPWDYNPVLIDRHPFFFIPSSLAKILHCQTPHEHAVRGALLHLGYRVSRSHCKAGSIKTNAPWHVLWEVMRQWVEQKAPVKEGAVKKGTPGWGIMHSQSWPVAEEGGNGATPGNPGGAQAKVDEGKEAATEEVARSAGKLEVVFDEKLGAPREDKKVLRYQQNPTPNWGPMNRASGTSEVVRN